MGESNDKLTVMITTDNVERVRYLLGLYGRATHKSPWWNDFHIVLQHKIIRLIKERTEFQESTARLVREGVFIEACRKCCCRYDAVELMESIGVVVRDMDHPMDLYRQHASLLID